MGPNSASPEPEIGSGRFSVLGLGHGFGSGPVVAAEGLGTLVLILQLGASRKFRLRLLLPCLATAVCVGSEAKRASKGKCGPPHSLAAISVPLSGNALADDKLLACYMLL